MRRLNPACLIVPLLAVTLAACGRPAGDSTSDTHALTDTLTQLIQDAYDFSRPGVVQRMIALYPDSGHVVSASGGHVIASVDSIRQGIITFWNQVGQNMRDPTWTWGDIHVDRLSNDAAALTAGWSIPHTAPDNQPHVIRGAWTAVFRRVDGRWKIIQEHLSVPAE